MASNLKEPNEQKPSFAAVPANSADTQTDIINVCTAAHADEMLVGMIFSKDRAMQLDATLKSFLLHCTDANQIALKVLYTATSTLHESQYEKLKKEYPFVKFIRETSFKDDLLTVLFPFEYVLFLVDDCVFVRDLSITRAMKQLEEMPHALGFSLRLGGNTTYCYMLNQPQALPIFDPCEDGVLCYDCGCIPVVHHTGSVEETLISGVTGFLYSPNTPSHCLQLC